MRIPLSVCTYGEEEVQAVEAVMRSKNVTMGEQCELFEREFAARVGVKHAVLVNSGSSANLLAWFALANPEFGSFLTTKRWEVIVPAVAWATTYWPIVQAGGTPVVVDCDMRTMQMDTRELEGALTDSTVAVCPVHVLGNMVNMTDVLAFSLKNNLTVVEDACEALGAEYGGRQAGTLGNVGTYSFYFSHHITSIEGGMVVTDNEDLADLMRVMRSHGWSRASKNHKYFVERYPELDPNFLFVTSGFNLRSTEVNAAIGRIQLLKLDGFNDRRREIAEYWNNAFRGFLHILPMRTTENVFSAPFGFPVMCITPDVRDRLKKHLNDAGIETRHIVGTNIMRHPAALDSRICSSGALYGANAITSLGLMWGLHPLMTDDEVEFVAKTVREFEA